MAEPSAPSLTWSWEHGWCYVYLGDKEVAHGRTMEEALAMLAQQLRRAEIKAKAREEET
jgi:hypothetical protein